MLQLTDMPKVEQMLQDRESQDVFSARLNYGLSGDFFSYVDHVPDDKYVCKDFQEYYERHKGDKIIIYGAGACGIYNAKALNLCGFKADAFCDSNEGLWGTEINHIPVISLAELDECKNQAVIVLSSTKYEHIGLMYSKLLEREIDRERIYYPAHGTLIGVRGWQYFDFFQPQEHEAFVDGGVFDGKTSADFAKWTHGKYDNIYLFEANYRNETVILETLRQNGIEDYELNLKGLSSGKGEFLFDDRSGGGARITSNGTMKIEVISMDEALKGKRISFIKLDVEGAEEAALLGAEQVIKQYKPRLAISIYHKEFDFVTIPLLLLQMNPQYQFAMRHYTTCPFETILYAW